MDLKLELFLQAIFMAAGGFALLLGLPLIASKVKGGLPLLAIATVLGLYYFYDQGYISF